MFLGNLFFSGQDWTLVAALIMAAALILLGWGYRPAHRTVSAVDRWICLALKCLGIFALVFCLLEPSWSGQRARPGANALAIVADNSQGLQIKDPAMNQSRGQMLSELLQNRSAKWQDSLEENFELRRYYFDSRLQASRDFSELDFDGKASAIGSSLRSLGERFRGRPLAGILLFTDGNATDLKAGTEIEGLPPIYPVIIGSEKPVRDIAVVQLRTTQSDFEDAPVSVQADVRATGYDGESVTARLIDVTGKVMQEQSMRARRGDEQLTFRFQFRPEKPGISFYRVEARAKSEAGDSTTATGEATLANNSRLLVADQGQDPHRILYVAGRPNWEFKFLNRALSEDTQLQLVGLIRVARREPKLTFMGRVGETSNPLFRGFGNQAPEEVERYDQPVLIRLNTEDEFELRAGFPQKAEELYRYDAVVIGDLEAEFFNASQAQLLQKFVSERGGGFAMLGGMESFQNGKYFRTPIGDMLPVYLDPVEPPAGAGPVKMELTKEGLLQSWARLRDTEAGEKDRLQNVVPFKVLNKVKRVKPGATTVASVTAADGTQYPAIVVQRFGQGKTASVLLGDLWRWGLRSAEARKDLDKAWRQFARWLVNEVPRRVELTANESTGDSGSGVRLQVRLRDETFQPLDNARVWLEVAAEGSSIGAGAQTNALRLDVEESLKEAGLYEATYVPKSAGGYRATVWATNSAGVLVGHASAGWATDPSADEFKSLTPNVPLLEALAKATGGEVLRPSELERFARDLPNRRAPVMEPWTKPFWHTPALFLFALGCFVSEWGLRRWRGLP